MLFIFYPMFTPPLFHNSSRWRARRIWLYFLPIFSVFSFPLLLTLIWCQPAVVARICLCIHKYIPNAYRSIRPCAYHTLFAKTQILHTYTYTLKLNMYIWYTMHEHKGRKWLWRLGVIYIYPKILTARFPANDTRDMLPHVGRLSKWSRDWISDEL